MNNIIEKINNFLGWEGLFFHTGRFISRIILAWIVIDFLVNKIYLTVLVNYGQIGSIAGALAIVSVILSVCWENLMEIFPEEKESKGEKINA